jgi:DNA primase
MADRADIDRVRDATDIVELVSEVTKVKRSGRSYMAICPFHQEKTPSMSLDKARGFYHCFGCGKGGDVFGFVEETQGVDFRDALEMLARKAGVTLTHDPADAQRRGRRAAAVEALRLAVEIYHRRLKKSPEAGPARAYLRARGYDVDLIDDWKLGFAGVDWETATKELKSAGVEEKALLDGGLSRRGRHGLYDVFRGRLIFPIHDVRGDPVGFGARRIEEIERDATNNPDAKYVNSADSIVYHKAEVLFGLDRARTKMSGDAPAIVVEGYTDVIAMHQAGVETAVATCGTALGDGHFNLLRRFSEKVVLAFDSDEAGAKAALRGDELETPFRLDLDLRVAVMPAGLDPADMVQQGKADELIEAVETARPLLEHRIEHEVGRHDLAGPEGRARALHAAAQQVRRINDRIARSEYIRFVAGLLRMDMGDVEAAVAAGARTSYATSPAAQRPYDRLEAELLRVALASGDTIEELAASDFTDARLGSAFRAIAVELGRTPPGTPADITKVDDPSDQAVLRELALDQTPLASIPELMGRIRSRRLDSEIDQVESELDKLGPEDDAYSDTLRRLIALQKEKRSPSES